MTGPDDEQLLTAASLGDRAAFGRFVRKHQAAVYRYLLTAAEGADAEDALQEAFVAAWKGAGSYRGGPSARGWLLAIARNALSRAHRRRVGEPATFEALDGLGIEAGWGSGEDVLEGLARRDLLGRALAAVPPEDREILVLRELDGLSGEEVAEVLGITLAAMKSRLHRARLRFVAVLREVAHG